MPSYDVGSTVSARPSFAVQESLEAQKQEFTRKEEGFKRREETLKKKDLDLQESLIRFSKFLQENDSKRTRAEKKVGACTRPLFSSTQALFAYYMRSLFGLT
jgi:hypothetical protein